MLVEGQKWTVTVPITRSAPISCLEPHRVASSGSQAPTDATGSLLITQPSAPSSSEGDSGRGHPQRSTEVRRGVQRSAEGFDEAHGRTNNQRAESSQSRLRLSRSGISGCRS